MAMATLGFSGGPTAYFRLDPDEVQWNWQMITSVTPTVGGRVIQVIGATLSDLTIVGDFGEDHTLDEEHGQSWVLAQTFYEQIRKIMIRQAADSRDQGEMQQPAVFTYSPRNWKFSVYVKDLSDPDGGGSITHAVGKYAYRYQLTLFVVEELSDARVKAGTSHGVLDTARQKSIDEYMARISDGIGWHFSQYNGPITTQGDKTPYSNKKPTKPETPKRITRNGKTFLPNQG